MLKEQRNDSVAVTLTHQFFYATSCTYNVHTCITKTLDFTLINTLINTGNYQIISRCDMLVKLEGEGPIPQMILKSYALNQGDLYTVYHKIILGWDSPWALPLICIIKFIYDELRIKLHL